MISEAQVCIVTGAAGGIGLATSRALLGAGARVVMADRDGAALAQVLADAGDLRERLVSYVIDVADVDQVAAMVAQACDRFGGIDMLVNNAGCCPVFAGVADLGVEDWDRILAANLRSVFLCSKAVLPHLRARGGGCIVNVASAAALYWPAGYPAYTAAKAGVLALTQCMAREVAGDGIAVKALRPVYVDTNMGRSAFLDQNGRPPDSDDDGTILQPEEVAQIICSMLDPATACATSTVVDTMVVRPLTQRE